MITVMLSGGLGNQMFQYAAGYSLAKAKVTSLCLNLIEFERYNLRHYMLDKYSLPSEVSVLCENNSKFIPARLQKYIPFKNVYFEPHYHYDPDILKISADSTVSGYFQSEKYFKTIGSEIREHFALSIPLSKDAQAVQDRIQKQKISISLHVRRGDYVSDKRTNAIHAPLEQRYYKKAVEMVQNIYGEDITFFIFSDDPDYAAQHFDFVAHKHIVQGETLTAHEDMHLMSTCQHHVIANSSFSWWGAWLNPSIDKTVIAPRQWFSDETLLSKSIKDLIPQGWITL